MTFIEKLIFAVERNDSLVCVGLDSDFEKIPECLKSGKEKGGNPPRPEGSGHPSAGGDFSSRQRGDIILKFNKAIIDATKDAVCAYKPNSAFYEALGGRGIEVLNQTIAYIKEVAPSIPVIVDAKRADIGSTNEAYVEFVFSYLGADAVTIHPYLGREAVLPFLAQKEKGIIVLCRTSNSGADEFQDLLVEASSRGHTPASGHPSQEGNSQSPLPRRGVGVGNTREELYKVVARRVATEWNTNGNCGLVVGATYPEELEEVRTLVGDMPILVPGIGAQGGDVEKTVRAGLDSKGRGIIVNSSRGIIFASKGEDFAERAKEESVKLRDEINKYR